MNSHSFYNQLCFTIKLQNHNLSFAFPSGATFNSEEAGSTDYPAGSAREGELFKGEEQSGGNASRGTMTFLFLITGACLHKDGLYQYLRDIFQ